MANATGAFGLRPVRNRNGTPWNGATTKCYVSSSYATAMFVGDAVVLSPTAAEKHTSGKYPTINQSDGATAKAIFGVIISFDPLPTDLEKVHNPVSTERYANVCVDPDAVYQIRGDAAGTAPTKVAPGQNFIITSTPTGSTTTGLSGMTLDQSSGDTTQAHPLHCIALANQEDNDLGNSALYEVILNTIENATGRFLGVTAS